MGKPNDHEDLNPCGWSFLCELQIFIDVSQNEKIFHF